MISVVALCLCVFVVSATAQSQKPAQVIDQMLAALGGSAFLDAKDIHTSGRFFAFTRGQLSGSDIFNDYIKFPEMERTEFGPPSNANKRTVTINRGKEGWKIAGKKEPEPQGIGEAEEFVKSFRTSFDYVLRFVLDQKQTTLQNLPSEIIDSKRIDVVELLDRDTHLPVKMQVRRTDESKLHEEQYSNWHKFQGVMTPMYVSRLTDGVKTMEIHLDTAAYDTGLSDNLFSPPPSK